MTALSRLGFLLLVYAVAALAPQSSLGSSDDDDQPQRDYLAALEAIRSGDVDRFKALSAKLQDYLLYGYLEYEYLEDHLDSASPAEIRRFLERNSDAPISDMLRKKWLHQLARRHDWRTFLLEYRDIEDDPELLCLRLGQELRMAENQSALMRQIDQLWFTGRRLPSACEPVFMTWKEAGHMTRDKIWERIRLAMETRNITLARDLAKHLDHPADRRWVRRWLAMDRDPVRELERIDYPVDTPVARMIVKHGVVRLAYRDPQEAMERWKRLKQRYQFFGEDENYVLRNIGILAAQDHLPSALTWLSSVSAGAHDETLQMWRIKAALREGDWATAGRFIAALPEDLQEGAQWQYWRARVLEARGRRREARRIYARLAEDRSYYGFLAADRVGSDYSMQHIAVQATREEISGMVARPRIQMARELYALGQVVEARRQWQWATRHMNNRELQVAAVVARRWGWYDRAILTVAKSAHQDDLDLRFPVLYRDTIEANAARFGIDPGWIYGVVRQESAFVVDARSHAGALGLMQLMPATGRLTGRKINLKVRNTSALLDVENNLRLGASYLKEVLDRYRGNQVLATASYNAGPNRVSDWMPRDDSMDSEIWVETIPYNETRNYVKNVLAFTVVYDHRLGIEPTRLHERMPAVDPTE